MYEVDKISSMSYREHIELRSTLHALTNRDFICSTCQSKHSNRPDAQAILDKSKKIKGCTQPLPVAIHKISQGQTRLNYSSCIGNFFSFSAMSWINFYNSFEQGVMPFGGGYMDQPSKFIDVMNIVGSYKQDEMIKSAKQQKNSARRARSARG